MARGRPPKPRERIAATARSSTRKANGAEIVPAQYKLPAAVVIPCASLDLGERGQAEWEKIWSAGFWLSPDQDYHWVEMIAAAYDEIEMYRATVRAEGLTVAGIHGTQIAHPLIGEIRKAQNVIIKCLSQLGFSPTDRARLAIADVKLKDAAVSLNDKLAAKK